MFSASLHVEYVDIDDFADKADWFVVLLDPGVRVVVNQVVLPDRMEVAEAGRHAIESRGLRWFPQLMKVDGSVVDYPDAERLRALARLSPVT